MTGPDPEKRFEELSKRIDSLPTEPPIIVKQPKSHLVVSLIQLAFVLIAFIGIIGLVLRIEASRIAQCKLLNQTRGEIVLVLTDASMRPNLPPQQREKLEQQIGRFQPINCDNPAEPVSMLTSGSHP